MANRASCCIEQLSTGTWINNDLQPQRKKIRFHFLPFDIAECRQFSTNNWFISWRWRQASNEGACQRACQVENEFLCRSYLYKDSSAGLEYNCQLYHLDHFSLPDGPTTFLTTDRPLLDDGEPVGKFVENVCISKFVFSLKNQEMKNAFCKDEEKPRWFSPCCTVGWVAERRRQGGVGRCAVLREIKTAVHLINAKQRKNCLV